jgi:sugar phosphate isomerase/epimerase
MERARRERLSFLDAVVAGVFTVPGDGCVDFPPTLQELRGYSGWAVVEAEQDPDKANPLEMARIGHKALTEAFGQAGFTIE